MNKAFKDIEHYIQHNLNSLILSDSKFPRSTHDMLGLKSKTDFDVHQKLYLYQRGYLASLEFKTHLEVHLERFERKFRMLQGRDYGNDELRAISQMYCLN
jgi:hypothetical protein